MAETASSDDSTDQYTVRRFRDGDREGFLSLYETVWGESRRPEWFAWRYEQNPFLSHVPVFVAEDAAGEIVGARPLAAFPMRTPSGSVVALHPSDTMVHPDHRRRGLFARMSKACTDYYVEADPVIYFNFPNEAALQGNLDFGYRRVGQIPTYYRIQSVGALLGDGAADGLRGRVAGTATAAYLAARDRTARVPADVQVDRHRDVPTGVLSRLYERDVPPSLHVLRDEAFYRWRFADPVHPATTYVASRGGEPVAAVVAYRDVHEGVERLKLADVVPMRETRGRTAAVRALLAAVVDEHRDVDVVVAVGSSFPADALRSFGFLPDDRPPLSAVTSPSTLVVYPLVPESAADRWTLSGRRLDTLDDWRVTYCARDTT